MGRASRAVWAKRVERWSDSGLTAKQFAAEIDVSPQSLSFWKWRLRKDEQGSARATRRRKEEPHRTAPTAASFVQLVPTSELTKVVKPVNAFELVLRSGLTVRVPLGFDETTLRRLVAMFGGG
jgi:hypothetical protein